jgi:hypothetical protein
MAGCEIEDLPPRESKYHFRLRGRRGKRVPRNDILTFIRDVFPTNITKFEVGDKMYYRADGVTLVRLVRHGLEYHLPLTRHAYLRSSYVWKGRRAPGRTIHLEVLRKPYEPCAGQLYDQKIGPELVTFAVSLSWAFLPSTPLLRAIGGKPCFKRHFSMVSRTWKTSRL